ncbi:G5 domain-containing protein, partial [Streptococcus sp. 5346]|uniref:G5 domain-containing protein n=1 Tax=Streptococcus sp. 5346 TaxID=2582636 RepID=UPI001564B652
MSRQSTKNKKYALRKIGKFFGSCVVATVITLGGAAIMAPNVTVYASDTTAEPGEANIENITSASEGYEVFVPKGKKYERDDTVESHTPVLREEGYNGRSFILKAEDSDDYFNEHPMESLFEKLYDKDDDGQIDEKYKRADADTINENAGKPIDDSNFVEPKVSEVNPKYPHRLDAGVSTPANPGNLYKGRPGEANGSIDSDDTIVESNKPITVNPNSEENIVNDDGTVVLSKYYRIHVNEGEHADKKDDIYVVGTKPKVVETPIPFETTYERDDSVPEGTEEEVTAGKNGETVKTTTYELNPTTGEVTANEPTSVTTDPVTRVVKKGTQPKVEKTPIPFETTYERDDSVPEGTEEEVTAGKNGETVKTTTYELNPTTGDVTANEPTSVTTDPVTRVVKKGTQPKVEKTPIPFPTRYERDDSVPEGTEEEVTAGKDGETVKTTTYNIDETTGVVTPNEPTSVTTDPVTRVVKKGTQPKVEKT